MSGLTIRALFKFGEN